MLADIQFRIRIYAMTLVVLVSSAFVVLTSTNANADLPDLPTPPFLVFDVNSGEIYANNREFDRWAPASLTKMMTAYTIFKTLELQHLRWDSPVRMSEYALSQPPSKMGFPVGTILTIETALKIIMVKSANDISVALAEAVAGNEENFVRLMNSHARRLGMKDSNFTNPHGLHQKEQFTTAVDMGILASAITKEFVQYAGFFDIPAVRVTGRRLRNHNALLRLFDGTTGMKTGYVCASGYNVVVRTKRKSRELISVVFGGRSGLERNIQTARLLTDAFIANTDTTMGKLNELQKPENVSDAPFDITRVTCPRKYAAEGRPKDRPKEAPSAQDFDGIDTIVVVERKENENRLPTNVPLPKQRPELPTTRIASGGSSTPEASSAEKETVPEAIPEDKPPSLRELAAIYFQPRTDLREDVKLNLNGAVGPNPFGIQHTNGGVYQPPIPVPQKRPALDLVKAEE